MRSWLWSTVADTPTQPGHHHDERAGALARIARNVVAARGIHPRTPPARRPVVVREADLLAVLPAVADLPTVRNTRTGSFDVDATGPLVIPSLGVRRPHRDPRDSRDDRGAGGRP